MLIDGHADTITKLYEKGKPLYENDEHLDIKRLSHYGSPTQFFAICLNPRYYVDALTQTLKLIEFHLAQFEKNAEFIQVCRNYEDIQNAGKCGKVSAILAVEGLYAVTDTEILRTFHRLGVRACNITWNYSNSLAAGVWDDNASKGLTEKGAEAVAIMNELGMIIDVSHLSEQSFYDVVKASEKPVIASHSNAWEMCKHPRNLKDPQIKAIADMGGTIGINYYANFLGNYSEKGKATIDDILRHTEHIINVGGGDVIALGSDFDGIDDMPAEFHDVMGHEQVLDAVRKRFGSELADKMAWGNLDRVLKEYN